MNNLTPTWWSFSKQTCDKRFSIRIGSERRLTSEITQWTIGEHPSSRNPTRICKAQ